MLLNKEAFNLIFEVPVLPSKKPVDVAPVLYKSKMEVFNAIDKAGILTTAQIINTVILKKSSVRRCINKLMQEDMLVETVNIINKARVRSYSVKGLL